MKRLILLTTLATAFSLANAAEISTSFSQAKNKLYKSVYQNSGMTFYVGCEWYKKKVNLESCGLQNSFSTKDLKRAKRTEAEHVIPASWFYKKNGQYRTCYKQAKSINQFPRKYCQEHDEDYRNAHNDLVNLRPAVGAINAKRSNKPFAESISGTQENTYRGTGGIIKISSRVVIPAPSIRGDIARIALYMQNQYGVTYTKRQQTLFKQWNDIDPITEQERTLNTLIIKAQGQGNFFIE